MAFRSICFFLLFCFLSFGVFANSNDSTFVDSEKLEMKLNAELWKKDSLWAIEQFSFQDIEADTFLLNEFNYNKNDIPTFSDGVLQSRLQLLNENTPFQLIYNRHVKNQIDIYSKRYRRHVATMLGKANYYFPLFEEVLDQYDLPLELKYLAVVESALKPHARSRSAATGLWQFMYTTGKIYDLNVTSYTDDRSDPLKSTIAACEYFTFLYKMFNDWELVLAAYNGGPGYVSRAMAKYDVDNYWSLRPFLRRETQNYVPKFIAVNYIMNYSSEHNIYPIEYPYTQAFTDTVTVSQSISFDFLQEILDVDIKVLRELNPIYKRDLISVPKNTKAMLTLPTEKLSLFIANQDTIYALSSSFQKEYVSVDEPLVHRVKQGEFLGKIASKYNSSVSQLMKWNNLKSTKLKIGQKLVVYVDPSSIPKNTKSTASVSIKETTTYTIKKGDTLWKISQQFEGVNSSDLEKLNNISAKDLKPGLIIKLPKVKL
jgi:membrane-bound lytic murein transglycosylase D